jgi:hypothetical protein
MEVAIVGCGPAGLLSALAVEQAGHKPWIVSLPFKSKMFGAMFLHRAIPEVTPRDPEFHVHIYRTGTREGYARNVYGDSEASVSWDLMPNVIAAWSLPAAYDLLWDKYEDRIHEVRMGPHELQALVSNFEGRVINSIPKHVVCFMPTIHKFDCLPISVVHGPVKGFEENNVMHYNGANMVENRVTGPEWYRFSVIQQYAAWEYRDIPSWEAIGTDYAISPGVKVVGTDCDCWEDVLHVGRFGRWEKGVLTHHAYEAAWEYAHAL